MKCVLESISIKYCRFISVIFVYIFIDVDLVEFYIDFYIKIIKNSLEMICIGFVSYMRRKLIIVKFFRKILVLKVLGKF